MQKAVFLPSQNTSVQSIKPYKGLLGFYKNYISSQDGETCSFEPSCSVYSSQCFKKHNFFYALFLTSDRLTRCNGHSHFYLKGKLSKPMDKP